MSEEEEKKIFNFLIISDIHESVFNARKIVSLMQKSSFDYVICCGDTVSIPTSKNHDRSSYEPYIPLLKTTILELEKIAPVLWVPGNHEPYPFSSESYEEISSKSKNMHKKILKLTKNLYIIGQGGSTPILDDGKWDTGFIPFKTLDYKKFKYAGFPYNVNNDYLQSDLKLKNDFEETLLKAKTESPDCQMIFLTHMGPIFTPSNSMEEDGDNLYLGSKAIGEIFERENMVFLDIHGHTHRSEGFQTMGINKYVFNPGSGQEGHYSTIKIEKDNNGIWKVKEITMDYL